MKKPAPSAPQVPPEAGLTHHPETLANRRRLPVAVELNYRECLLFLNRSDMECTHSLNDDAVRKAFCTDGRGWLSEIRPAAQGGLTLTLLNGDAPADWAARLAAYVRDWWDLDRDLQPFYLQVQHDRLLAPLVARYRGLRLLGYPQLFEALSWAVIGQQINLSFAYQLRRRLVHRYGGKVTFEGHSYWVFPDAATIAGARRQDLLAMQFSRQKTDYLIAIAAEIADGRLSRESLQAMEPSAARERLLQLRGVGPWTADYVMMKCLRNPSAFPVGDVGLQNAVRQLLRLPGKPTEEELRELARPWSGWEAYATFYLWRTLI